MPADNESPTTPLEVTQYIGRILRRKRALLDELHRADVQARALRREATALEARKWLIAEGSIPAKKYKARTHDDVRALLEQADVAEAAMWHLRGLVSHCGDELEGARTAAATLRAELGVLHLNSEGA